MAEGTAPSRRIMLNDCSRLVDGRNGKPYPVLCFSSVLRLCLCPGKCRREAVEFFGVRPLLAASGGYDSDDGAAFCHTVSSRDYGRMPTTQLRHLVICGGGEGLEFNLLLDPGTPTG